MGKWGGVALFFCLGTVLSGIAAGVEKDVLLFNFVKQEIPAVLTENNVSTQPASHDKARVLQVDFGHVDWPNVFFTPREGGVWDWSDYAGITILLHNPGNAAVEASVRVDNAGADGSNHCNTGQVVVPAHGSAQLEMRFRTADSGRFWGMRGTPAGVRTSQGATLETGKITAFQVYLSRPDGCYTLLLDEVRLIRRDKAAEDVAFPFIDRFGQYMHAKWPGKLKGEKDFAKRRKAESRALARRPELAGRDPFGGWADGPQLEATGWFRAEKIDGKWWLVTPSGHLFLSIGVNCVYQGDSTFVEGREAWFSGMPAADDALFKGMYGSISGVHSMADVIGGKGRTFNFYQANLARKYGADWAEPWRTTAYARLRSWGFTTIGNWANWEVVQNSPMPYVVTIGGGNARPVEGAKGYWGPMKDVFDPAWPASLDKTVAEHTKAHADKPLCIGYFVDNELSWETVRAGTLSSPPDQPCRQAFIAALQAKYGDIAGLNAAWATNAADWDSLRAPEQGNAACSADLDAFEHRFARRYFEGILGALRVHAPHQLYLGCRFATSPPMAVKACAEVADVVSFNRYMRTIRPENWVGDKDLGKPLMVGEFHFGALDRGMFHTGLVRAKDQDERAAMYAAYVRSVVDCPAFVGCHWFQYMDQPTTGRSLDGENYNIGLVNITDTPYPELIKAARGVHEEMYSRRWGK